MTNDLTPRTILLWAGILFATMPSLPQSVLLSELPRKHSISTIMQQINWKYIALLWVCVSLLHQMVYIVIGSDMPPSFQSYILATNSNTSNMLVGSQIGLRQRKK